MSLVVRKPVFGVSNQVPHIQGCTITKDDKRLEISYLGCRGIVLQCIHLAKIKALISFAVTAKLICVFVFAYAKAGFLTTRLNYGVNWVL